MLGSSENSIIIHKEIYNEMLEALKKNGAYLCSNNEKSQLENLMWKPGKTGRITLNPGIIAQSAEKIA